MQRPGLSKKSYICSFQTSYPYLRGFYATFFGLLDQFGWQSPFLVAHFGWLTVISEDISAGYPNVAVKISNWLGTHSHHSNLSGPLVATTPPVAYPPLKTPSPYPQKVDNLTFFLTLP